MSRLEKSNQEVSTALDLLNSTLVEEKQRIYDAGADAMKHQDSPTARSVLDFADKLEEFRTEVQKLVKKWNGLLQIRNTATPAVQEIVTGEGRLFQSQPRKTTSGFTRTIDHPLAPKTNFEIHFPDGTVIAEYKACDTLIKGLHKIGFKRVFDLGILVGGEPLVSQTPSRKYPSASKKVPGGYYVLLHSSTKSKVSQLLKIRKLLGLEFEIKTHQAVALRKTQA